MKKIIHILLFGMILQGCINTNTKTKMDEIDSLVIKEQYDSAYATVSRIDPSILTNREDLAHYYLLLAQTSLLTGHPDTTAILDSMVIPYYNNSNNHEKLAEALYYDAYKKVMRRNYPDATIELKKAEVQAEHSENLRLQYKIAESLSAINELTGNHLLQLEYARKALQIGEMADKKEWIGYAFFRLAVGHSKLQHNDSARFYMDKAIPYSRYFKKEDQPAFINNVAYVFKHTQPEIAKKYLRHSLSLYEHSNTLLHLADIYYDEGDHEEAYRLWKRALVLNNGTRRDHVLFSILTYDMERGDTSHACEIVREIVQIKDSMLYSQRNDTIKDLQLRFDHEVAMRQQEQVTDRWKTGVFIAVIIILLLLGIIIIRRNHEEIRKQKHQMQISDYVSQIHELEAAGQESGEEIARLSKMIKDYLDEKAPDLLLGRAYYEDIKENKIKTLQQAGWKKKDEQLFIDYYAAIDYRTVNRLKKAKRKEPLTTHLLFFLLLKEMGKSDEYIQTLFGTKPKAIEVYKSRTKEIK